MSNPSSDASIAHAPHAAEDATDALPFEVAEQIAALTAFLGQKILVAGTDDIHRQIRLGAVRWGAYAFFDYDNEPIYVGQTRESLGSRIGRHFTG
jgi:hypothetical protein